VPTPGPQRVSPHWSGDQDEDEVVLTVHDDPDPAQKGATREDTPASVATSSLTVPAATSPPRESVDSAGEFDLPTVLTLRHSRVQEEARRSRRGGSSVDFLAHLQPEATSPDSTQPPIREYSDDDDGDAHSPDVAVSEVLTTLKLAPLPPTGSPPQGRRPSAMGVPLTPETNSISRLLKTTSSEPNSPLRPKKDSNGSIKGSAAAADSADSPKLRKSGIPRLSSRISPGPTSPGQCAQTSSLVDCVRTHTLQCAHVPPPFCPGHSSSHPQPNFTQSPPKP
jgi:hypothetical protein